MVHSMSGLTDTTLAGRQRHLRSGGYGVTIPIADITGLQLAGHLSCLGGRVNAFQVGNSYVGSFAMKPYGEAELFLNATKPPFVLVQSVVAGMVLFNAGDSAATRAVFDR